MVGSGGNWSIHRQWQISTLTLNKRKCTMKQYKVVDDRNMYRNDPTCEIRHDNEKAFVMNKTETDSQGNKTNRTIILNPRKFQEERVVDEQEAILLMLKGVKVEELSNE
jgi:hypothetical protein